MEAAFRFGAVLLVISITTQILVEPLTAQQPQVPIPTAQELDQMLAPIALYPDAPPKRRTAQRFWRRIKRAGRTRGECAWTTEHGRITRFSS